MPIPASSRERRLRDTEQKKNSCNDLLIFIHIFFPQISRVKTVKEISFRMGWHAFVPFKGEVFHESALRTIRVLSNTEPDVSLVTITCWIPVGDTFGG